MRVAALVRKVNVCLIVPGGASDSDGSVLQVASDSEGSLPQVVSDDAGDAEGDDSDETGV